MPTTALPNEKHLLILVAQGEEIAYKQLFTHYWDQVYSTALLFTKSREISQDLAQDIFAKIWIKRTMLSEVNNFEAFLFITARNLIFDKLRKKVFTTENEAALTEYFEDASMAPDLQVEYKEMEEIIQRGIDVLPDRQRSAFCLSRFQGLRHDEIALQMGISKESVKSNIVRAISHLRKYLAEHSEALPFLIALLIIS